MNLYHFPAKTLAAISKLICGSGGVISRGLDASTLFFQSAGLPIPTPINQGVFATDWVEARLLEYSQTPEYIERALVHIIDRSHFLDRPELFEPTLTRLQQLLAPIGFTVEVDGITPYLRQIPPSFRFEHSRASPLEPTPEFSLICPTNPIWIRVLRSRWDEAERCVAADAPLAAIVMFGSILEGALKATGERFIRESNQAHAAPKDASGRVKPFREWTLWDWIQVSEELGRINAEARRLGHALREYRNLIHPSEQVRSEEFPTRDSAHLCRRIVLASLNSLTEWLKNQAP